MTKVDVVNVSKTYIGGGGWMIPPRFAMKSIPEDKIPQAIKDISKTKPDTIKIVAEGKGAATILEIKAAEAKKTSEAQKSIAKEEEKKKTAHAEALEKLNAARRGGKARKLVLKNAEPPKAESKQEPPKPPAPKAEAVAPTEKKPSEGQ